MNWAPTDEEFRARIAAYNRENNPKGIAMKTDPPAPKAEVLSIETGQRIEKPKNSIRWVDMSDMGHRPNSATRVGNQGSCAAEAGGPIFGGGGTGKSIIELMKNVAHVAGKDWLGSLPEPGPAFYIGAEDDENEIHIRLSSIATHYNVDIQGSDRRRSQGALPAR